MNLYRVIVRMYRRSEGLSTGPDDPNTLTRQSAGTNNDPRYLPPQPRYMESWPTWPAIRLRLHLRLRSRVFCCEQQTIFCCIEILPITTPVIPRRKPCHQHRQLCTTQWFWLESNNCYWLDLTYWFLISFDSPFPDLIQLTGSWLYST